MGERLSGAWLLAARLNCDKISLLQKKVAKILEESLFFVLVYYSYIYLFVQLTCLALVANFTDALGHML